MEISFKGSLYHLSGRIDEHADFGSLSRVTESVMRLHLAGITSMNSVGVRKLLAFALGWSPKKFEFYECTPEFIVNVNVIPQLLGSSRDGTQIKSFYVPYSCEACHRLENVLYKPDGLTFKPGTGVDLTERLCSQCGEVLDLDVDKHDFFLFLSKDAD